jgi:hypothetical protein
MINEARLQQTLDRIQKDRPELLSQLDGLSLTQMDFKPAARSWSLGEVAHHLCLAEKMLQSIWKDLLREGSGGWKTEPSSNNPLFGKPRTRDCPSNTRTRVSLVSRRYNT